MFYIMLHYTAIYTNPLGPRAAYMEILAPEAGILGRDK